MEGENAHVAERAGLLSVHFASDGLGRVLDEDDAAVMAQFGDGGHVGHVAVEVHDDDGLRAGRHGGGYGLGRGHVRVQVDVAPFQLRALLDIRIRGSGERMRGNDELVAFPEAAELRGHLESGRGVADSEAAALFHALVARERGFELLEVMALGQGLGRAHGFDDRGDFVFRVMDGAAAEIDSEFHKNSFLLVRTAGPAGQPSGTAYMTAPLPLLRGAEVEQITRFAERG